MQYSDIEKNRSYKCWNCCEKVHRAKLSVDWEAKKAEGISQLSTFQLEFNVESPDLELSEKISTAIRNGPRELNPDLELFNFVKNEFNALDCMCIELDHNKIELVQSGQVEITPWVVHSGAKESLAWSVNYPINQLFMLTFGYKDGFYIPGSVDVNCSNRCVQEFARLAISARELAQELELPITIPEIYKKYDPVFICGDHYEELMIQKVIVDANAEVVFSH